MRGLGLLAAVLAVTLVSLASCDAVTNLVEPQWEVAEANGKDGQFHFVMNSYAMRIGQPENVRVERVETKTIHKPGGEVEVQKRARSVRVVLARCESGSICSAIPRASDAREIVVTPKGLGGTTLYVTAVVDEKEELKDAVGAQLAVNARALAPAAAMLAIGAIGYPSTGTDDSYITYWPAYALAHHGAIVNVNRERVEQSSSLLWTLILAFVSKVTRLDVESLGVPLSVLAGLATIGATGLLARRIDPRAEEAARWLVALSFPSLLWSFSGMETALAAFLWTTFAACSIPYLFEQGGSQALLASLAALTGFVLVRPEAPAVVLTALVLVGGLSVAAYRRSPELGVVAKRVALLLLTTVAAAAAVALFRHAYFGAWVPQPVHAKVGSSVAGTLDHVLDGLLYVLGFESVRGSRPPGWPDKIEVGLVISLAVVASAIAATRFVTAAARADRGVRAAALVGIYFAASLSFAVVVGGDWMGGWRFLVTPLPCALALLAPALVRMSPRVRGPLLGATLAFELLVLVRTATVPGLTLPLWTDLPATSRAFPFFVRHNVPHLRDAAFMPAMEAAVRRVLATRGTPVTVLSGQAGYVVHQLGKDFFGQVRFVDRVSLVTRDLQDCPLLVGTHTDVGFSLATTEPLFDPASRVHAECGIPLPDIVFDNGRRQLYDYMMQSRLYDVVFEEGTEMLPAGTELPASRTYQYLGVRR